MSKGRGSESTLKFGDVTRLLQRFFPGASPLNSAFSELLTSMTSLGKPRGYTGPVVISFYEFREVVLIGVLIREILAGVQLLFECDGPGNVRNSGNPQKTSSRKAVTFGPEQNATRVHKEEISKIIMGVLDRVNVGSVPYVVRISICWCWQRLTIPKFVNRSDFQDVVNRLLNALLFPSILSGQATSNAAEGEGDIRFDKPGPSAVNAAHNATGSTVTQEQFVGWIASRLRLIH
ncbi:hypothetical protein BJ742DRAFT_813594 [Cladochytrium replicatum]|nr:hypothetical protein BJ742DRAFT_813594 [Cladochytrium replicatum]